MCLTFLLRCLNRLEPAHPSTGIEKLRVSRECQMKTGVKHGGNKAKEIIIQIVINYNICVTEIVMQKCIDSEKKSK